MDLLKISASALRASGPSLKAKVRVKQVSAYSTSGTILVSDSLDMSTVLSLHQSTSSLVAGAGVNTQGSARADDARVGIVIEAMESTCILESTIVVGKKT